MPKLIIGCNVIDEKCLVVVFEQVKNKLSYCCTIYHFHVSRVLIANQVLLAYVWYVSYCWGLHTKSIDNAHIKNYV